MAQEELKIETPAPQVELSESERTASEKGWKPKEEFLAAGGVEDKWVDHKEFNQRTELYDVIHVTKKEVKKLKEQVDLLSKQNKEIAEAKLVEFNKTKAALEAELKLAAEQGDTRRYMEVDVAKRELEATAPKPATTTITPSNKEVFDNWKEQNSWYETDEDLTAYALGYGSNVEKTHPDWTPAQILGEIEKKIKQVFPTKFIKQSSTPTVMTNKTAIPINNGVKKRITFSDLPTEGQAIAKRMIKSKTNPYGVLSEEDYLKQYALKQGLNWEE